jgi:PKD repeat protein
VTRLDRGALFFGLLSLTSFVSACASNVETANVPPVAIFVYSPVSPINAGQTQVVFNASGSTDSDGSIASYTWDFGDTTAQQTTQAASITHVFPKTSRCVDITYTVLLTVTDNKGATNSASNTVTVTNLPAPGSLECQ